MAGKTRHVLIAGDFAAVNGGQAKVAIDSARLLAEAGLGITFFAATGPVSALLDHPGIRVVCLGQHTVLDDPDRLRAMRRGIWNGAAARALAAEAARHDPASTVLHCHGYAKALSPSIGPVLASGPLRSVYTMHEYFLACPNGGFYNYRRGEICGLKPMGAGCLTTNCDARHAAHKAWRVLRGAVANGPGRLPQGLGDVIYISQTQRRAMEPWLAATTRLHHLPNPVEVTGGPVDAKANRDFVFVGRLNPEKGGAIFAAAARRAGVRAVFVGDGPERAAILAANPEAEITGWVDGAEVGRRLARARALVFPSLWYEGQPLAPIEALVRGIPVVAGNWTAAAEELRDGQNGVIYDSPDATALAAALGRVDSVPAFDGGPLAARLSGLAHVAGLTAIYDHILSR